MQLLFWFDRRSAAPRTSVEWFFALPFFFFLCIFFWLLPDPLRRRVLCGAGTWVWGAVDWRPARRGLGRTA